MGTIRVGTSGWAYHRWRGDYYPSGLPWDQELAHASRRLTSIEINASFYALQRPTSYATWHDATPEGFVFAVKGGRYITHMKKLRDVEAALANFFASGLLALDGKLGPVLWQLPASLPYDERRMRLFYELLPRTTGEAAALAQQHDDKLATDRALTETAEVDRPVRHVLEFRHQSFCAPAALDQMREHDIGCVIADTAGRWPQADAVTSDDVYVRLHGEDELYTSGYGEASLRRWAARCRDWAGEHDVHVYFDNDASGHAPHDAETLLRLLAS